VNNRRALHHLVCAESESTNNRKLRLIGVIVVTGISEFTVKLTVKLIVELTVLTVNRRFSDYLDKV
jgi:hypothetical protein